MKIIEYLSDCSKEELIDRLLMIDSSLRELHRRGMFVVGSINSIEIIDNRITMASFNNKIDYLNSGFNVNGDKIDILELCTIGVCAFNQFKTFYSNKEFIAYLNENLSMFKDNIPRVIYEYYENVFVNNEIDYLSNYLIKKGGESNGKENVRKYTKATAVGRAFSEQDNAFVNILVLPAIACLLYLVFMIIYTYVLK